MNAKDKTAMMDRRALGKGLIAVSAGIAGAATTSACAASPARPVGAPLPGPWTATGTLQRALLRDRAAKWRRQLDAAVL